MTDDVEVVGTTERLVVPQADRLRVSVLMVLYGRADMALRAIEALIANTPPCYELIIIDNASPDDTLSVLREQVAGATIISNTLNVGFSAAASVAALHARGELLLLLNSDVFVMPDWLPPLLTALDGNSLLAGVSPALMNTDGSLQEAGSVLFSGGQTTSINDGERWAIDFPRTAPYISAACLLVRRSVFSAVGGLDTVYGRGYFEDVEFALQLEEIGLSLAHVPDSFAIHVHGASSVPSIAERLTHHNREIFLSRWGQRTATLPQFELPLRASTLLRGRDAMAPDRILLIDDRVSHVDRGSGDARMAQIATRLATSWPSARITLLAASSERADVYAPALLAAGVEVAACSHADAADWFEQRVGHFSAVLLSRPHNVARFRSLVESTQPQALIVVDAEALYWRRTARRGEVLAASGVAADREAAEDERRLSVRQRDLELDGWTWASVIICVCDEEADEVRRAAPGTPVVVVQSAAVAPARIVPVEERDGLLFLGGFMAGETSPNADSVHHLVDELMPRWWRHRPELHLTIAGADPTPSVLACAGDRVSVLGWVADPVATMSRHLVHVVPERFGAGVQLKLIESLACGTPFVTSSVGAQGLHLGDLAEHLVADDPDRFVALTEALLDDRDLWRFVQGELLHRARQHFSWSALDRSLMNLMALLGAAPPAAQRNATSSVSRPPSNLSV